MVTCDIWAWRHPQPQGVAGRCIGRCDVPVDRRKVKRLAHRIRQLARRQGLPCVVHTSPLQRCRLVGQQLRRWGWHHVIDARLFEADFGEWDGRAWQDIPHEQVDAWVADFVDCRPGGGESLREVLHRAETWGPQEALESANPGLPVVLVAHAGWMLARRWVFAHSVPPTGAHEWPTAPAYGQCWQLR